MSEQGPDNPNVLVGQRDRGHVLMPPIEQPVKPDPGGVHLAFRRPNHRPRAVNEQSAQIATPRLLMPKSTDLPPEEC